MQIVDSTPFTLAPGEYDFVATISTGPIVFQVKPPGGAFQNMTDGSFTVSADGVIKIAEEFTYQATIPAGDTLFISITDSGL